MRDVIAWATGLLLVALISWVSLWLLGDEDES